jgi:hypothetical protein
VRRFGNRSSFSSGHGASHAESTCNLHMASHAAIRKREQDCEYRGEVILGGNRAKHYKLQHF